MSAVSAAATLAAVSTGNGKALWYLTRATGMVSLILLTASLVLGIVEVNRWASPRWPRFVTAALHKNVSLLAVAFLAVHIVTSIADAFAPIRWLDVFVPFASPYRPIWLGLGTVAVDLLIAITVTSLVRVRLGYRAWKLVHWASYACWPIAFAHGIGTGSDVRPGWALLVNVGCLGAVLLAAWWRLAVAARSSATPGAAPAPAPVRLTAFLATIAIAVAALAFMVTGPMRRGWARRAGTPVAVLAKAAAANGQATSAASSGASPSAAGTRGSGAGASTAASSAAAAWTLPFTTTVQGTVNQTAPDASGTSTVVLDLTLAPPRAGNLHITLRGTAVAGGGIQMTSSAATMGPPASPNLFQGQVVALQGTDLQLVMRDGSGRATTVTASLVIDPGGAATGRVRARTGGDR